jgi:hypothetical protein
LLFGQLTNGGSVRIALAAGGEGLVLDIRPAKSPELLGQD